MIGERAVERDIDDAAPVALRSRCTAGKSSQIASRVWLTMCRPPVCE
jgi:hypothetical protein